MLFSSFVFLLFFLPLALLCYHICRVRGWQLLAKLALILLSVFFYAWWDWHYVPLILGSILFNYVIGFWVSRNHRGRGPAFLLGIVGNLGLLGYFKYCNFFVANVAALTGVQLSVGTVLLPLAISFFTFQQIAYLVETHRGEPPSDSLLDYMMFILFFPHLIAGPITHHREMLPQFARAGRGTFHPTFVTMGATVFVLGLAKKVLLADTLAGYADPVFGVAARGELPGMADAWLGALGYTLQLYFDFSGYSDMAIGLGLLFGIRFPVNFASPYKARNIIDFWRFWHITLSAFLRNYLYIPLGGNRKGPARRYANLMATMLLGGLWHGAGWTFVIWGGLHGLYLAINHAWRALVGERHGRAYGLAAWALTFLAVVVGWVFFRAVSVPAALGMLQAMIGAGGLGEPRELPGRALGWFVVLGAAAIAFRLPNTLQLADYPRGLPAGPDAAGAGRPSVRHSFGFGWRQAATATALGVLAGACFARLPDPGVFIYFNF